MNLTWLALAILFVATVLQGAEPGHVRATLASDTAVIEPGKPFTMGVLLRVAPGWHVYWKNPGDAGLATSAAFSLPQGFKVGPLQWPIPVRFEQPGGIVGYGYADEVLLQARVVPPANLKLDSTMEAWATASWLACNDVCIPGGAKPGLKLRVAEKAVPGDEKLFARWRDRYPMPADSPQVPFKAEVTGSIGPGGSGTFLIAFDWKDGAMDIEWLPTALAALKMSDVAIQRQEKRTLIRFKAEVLRGMKLAAKTLETLVVYGDTTGQRRGVSLPVVLEKDDR